MDSILTLARTEGMLFKFGSGTGSNLSAIRSSKELLAGGGTASGPVSFMKGYDAFAGVIKSGGKTRRAAKMVILNAEHPDMMEFINCKVEEEEGVGAHRRRLRRLVHRHGLYLGLLPELQQQRARDRRLHARGAGRWRLVDQAGDRRCVAETYKARELMRGIAEGTWVCGDPGMQFDTTVNEWHTCPNTDRINASNPCSNTCSWTTRRATWRRST